MVNLEQQLEKVQLFATRIASKQWSESANTLNSHFNLPSLCSRRTNVKFLYLYKLVNGYMSFARTSAFFNSFFISSVRAWNSLPSDIHCKKGKVVLTQFGDLSFLLSAYIVKHSGVPLLALDPTQIMNFPEH